LGGVANPCFHVLERKAEMPFARELDDLLEEGGNGEWSSRVVLMLMFWMTVAWLGD